MNIFKSNLSQIIIVMLHSYMKNILTVALLHNSKSTSDN